MMKILGIRQFKASLSELISNGEKILITSRGRPVGWFLPLTAKELKQVKKELGMRLVGLGEGAPDRISERHDEVLYE